MSKRYDKSETFIKYVPVIYTCVSFFGGVIISIVTQIYWFGTNIAQIKYVDQKHEEALHYTDMKVQQTSEENHNYSESTKKDLMIEIRTQGGDIKTVNTKQDALIESLKTLQQYILDHRR